MNQRTISAHLLHALGLLFFIALGAHAQSPSSPSDTLPPPKATKSVMNFSNVKGWDSGGKPVAPEGFVVTPFADGFDNPRWMYVLPNGDVLVAESNSNYNLLQKIGGWVIGASASKSMRHSADRITLLRDENKDGLPERRETFLTGLNQPFGMLLLNDWFYVANTDAIIRYPYEEGTTKIVGKGEKIVDLPAGKHNIHWTRNIIASKDGSKIYIAIGAGSNIAEHGLQNEILRANILEMNPDGSQLKVFAGGLRNPVGMDWLPGSDELWTVVNERDKLGDELVPDYLTSVQEGGFYGWPYAYFGHKDTRVKEKELLLVEHSLIPDVPLIAHTASLGLKFYTHDLFPEKFHEGAFVAQHGSWNRATLSGYKVIFIPFENGQPSGEQEDFLTGFIDDLDKEKVHGRPTGLAIMEDGSLLVTDDVSDIIWRVSVQE